MTTTRTDFAAGIAAIVSRMPAGHVQALAGAVEVVPCYDPGAAGSARNALPNPAFRQHAEELLAWWQRMPGLSGESFGLILLVALATRARSRRRSA